MTGKYIAPSATVQKVYKKSLDVQKLDDVQSKGRAPGEKKTFDGLGRGGTFLRRLTSALNFMVHFESLNHHLRTNNGQE